MNSVHKLGSKQRGIALFQVLLICAIIAVLAIQFTQTAKNQVAIARTISDRVQAQVALKTAESEILFSLLTKRRVTAPDNAITQVWNFYNKPFWLNDSIQVEIQDQYSLVSLYKGQRADFIQRLIDHLAVEGTNASVIVNSLIDWQDIDSLKRVNGAERGDYSNTAYPTNLPLQNIHEFSFVNGVNQALFDKISPLITVRPQAYFNPLNAQEDVLLLILDQQKVENLIQLRENGNLTREAFIQLTSMEEDESVFFATSGLLKVMVSSYLNDVALSKTIELYLQPYNNLPLIEYGVEY